MLIQMNNRAEVSICGMVIDIMRKDHGRFFAALLSRLLRAPWHSDTSANQSSGRTGPRLIFGGCYFRFCYFTRERLIRKKHEQLTV